MADKFKETIEPYQVTEDTIKTHRMIRKKNKVVQKRYKCLRRFKLTNTSMWEVAGRLTH